ncbi:ATP-binding protein [Bacteroides stercoris]|jgi:nitrogen fixation/metabolism regulation signal transduction histidine kinase|uniref:histidine kinase n=1 Tax=Bacteroides stercoris TaxID=46506 RepID=A0A7J5L4D4_BACSE|nr:ATP-binding protein [Bacteroides stercoris]KAB5261241.1 ATP-binding protein [Bacteroides stercoris]KAB5263656.1 ATP-binding protein [Bacteroides stercoris]KAB5282439.1 ATP-binding protein [Bacteroides stercoris]KAB5285702.1 ATP-binding protein [Bacteroides stercoris]KAB5293205.1 ATP-binding protein [Bacteroides stercoris]
MGFEKPKDISQYYVFRTIVSLLTAAAAGIMWTLFFLKPPGAHGWGAPLLWAVLFTVLLPLAVYWQQRLYRRHTRKVLFMLDAIENSDTSVHFSETDGTEDNRLVNRSLNRVARILHNVKSETAQREKYYELILDCVNTGIVVLNDNGAVYQKNNEALRLLGLEVFTHVRQLSRVDAHLTDTLTACRPGDKFQAAGNERGTVNLSVRVSDITVRQEHLRILALNDINNELDEKEIDSWIRLTRVLTHEIMNAVTPITSLSDTLLELTEENISKEEVRHGLQTISSTGKGLLAFVESYRKFTRIPTPEPSLFYLKGFINRMVELARHQHPDIPVVFNTSIVPDDLILYADENLISQVITNLLKNAIQAFETHTPATTETNTAATEATTEKHINIRAYCNEAEAVLIEISNNGPAIPPDIAGHIFIPFFTTKENGSGIGLSISRQIMRLSGGSLSLIAGKETTFVLKFN